MIFDISLSLLDNGEFEVTDSTTYDSETIDAANITDYMFVEYLIAIDYANTKTLISDSVVYTDVVTPLSTFGANFNYTYTLTLDGSYSYIKAGILKEDSLPETIEENTIYYGNDGYIYLYSSGEATLLTLLTLNDNYNYLGSGYKATFFSTCMINKCLINYQEKLLPIFIDCRKDFKADKLRRDFLLDANYILQYYIHIDNIPAAQALLERLQTCNDLCTSDVINSLTSCNCG